MSVSAEKAAPRVSERGRRVPASPIRKLASYADAAKKRGVKVYHLNIGQPDLETPAPMRDRLSQIKEKTYAYTPSNGTSECLDFFVGYYRGRGVELTRSQVITTTGGSEAIQFAFMACCETGDQVLLVEPFYTNYRAFAAMGGIELTPIVTRAEDGFHLPSREEWEKALTPRTKAVLLCNPNNPTGTVYSREELVRVAEFCRDHGLFLIADEVYREFVYDGREIASALSLGGFEDVVVVVDSLSKRYSACGIRLGCLATRNPEVYQACLHMAQGRLSPPGLAQAIAPGAALLGPEYVEGVVTEYGKRRDILFNELTKIPGIFFRKPEGAFYFVARIPVKDSEDFAQWLLTDFQLDGATVMVAPADGFYATPGLGKDEVRIAYVLKSEDLEAACRVLEAAIPAYRAARGL